MGKVKVVSIITKFIVVREASSRFGDIMTLRTQGTNSFQLLVSIREGIMMGNFASNQKLSNKVLYFNYNYMLSTKTKTFINTS